MKNTELNKYFENLLAKKFDGFDKKNKLIQDDNNCPVLILGEGSVRLGDINKKMCFGNIEFKIIKLNHSFNFLPDFFFCFLEQAGNTLIFV